MVFNDSPVPAKSVHGERHTVAIGKEIPSSRNFITVANVKPPPAESPAITMEFGSIFSAEISHLYAATASYKALGNGNSGASRYSSIKTRVFDALEIRETRSLYEAIEPTT